MSVRRGLLLVGVGLAAALSVFALRVLREPPAPPPALIDSLGSTVIGGLR